MSSGLITIAHDSAGPKLDIIGGAKEPVGYLAKDLNSYKMSLISAMTTYETESHQKMLVEAREHIQQKFGVDQFNMKFVAMVRKVLV